MTKFETRDTEWQVIDIQKNTILGRVSVEIAKIIIGKYNHKMNRADVNTGDNVIVLNVQNLFTHNKKIKYRHTGYTIKSIPLKKKLIDDPVATLTEAVRNMLPKTSKNRLIKKLKVYIGHEHQHTAQKPKTMKFNFGNKNVLRSNNAS